MMPPVAKTDRHYTIMTFMGLSFSKVKIMQGGILQEDPCLQNDFYGSVIQQSENHAGGRTRVSRMTFMGLSFSKVKIMQGGILQEDTCLQNDFYGSVIQQSILQEDPCLQNDFYGSVIQQSENHAGGSLCKLVKDKPSDWDKHLDAVMFGLRTKRQMTTKFSPYYLMFGREARYPSEIPEVYQIDKSVEGTLSIEEMTESAIAISEALTEARINTRASQERIRRQTKDKKGLNKFKVGDRVWRKNIRSQQRKGGKLEANFLGPYIIILLEDKSADLVDERGVTFPKINVDHLRLHVEELPRIPHKLKSSSQSASVPVAFASATSPASALLVSPGPASPVSLGPASPVSALPVSPGPTSPVSPTSVNVVSSAPSSPASAPPVHVTSSGVVTSSGPSSSDTESRVKEIWGGKGLYVLISKIGPFKLFYSDIQRTAPTQYFESEMDPKTFKYIFGVINEHQHWTLTIMIPQEKRALYLDPLGETSTNIQKCENVTRSFMKQKGYNVPNWTCGTLPHSCQNDGSSCGPFVLKLTLRTCATCVGTEAVFKK
ncbi:myosin-1 isoform X3 [Labeo rohita]|uniref:Myosin-1 isoform X3 n=1 Tax=Labeo rohita TaxID=84645 RepID=A0A498NQX4_LABRO|nr:myosin-1 isoform X3 [Labeo rohita]